MRTLPLPFVASLVGAVVAVTLSRNASCAEAEPDAPARAATPRTGLELSANVAASMPFGIAAPYVGFRDYQDYQESAELGIGWCVHPQWYVGAYGAIGYVVTDASNVRCGGKTCSGRARRLGIEARHYLLPSAHELMPWVSIATGYEDSRLSVDGVGEVARFSGIEIAALRLGLDFRVSPSVALGPLMGGSLGVFQDAFIKRYGDVAGDHSTFHGWLSAGVRASFM